MRATEVIKQLQQLVEQHGDLEVVEILASAPGTSSGGPIPLDSIECVALKEYLPNKIFLLSF